MNTHRNKKFIVRLCVLVLGLVGSGCTAAVGSIGFSADSSSSSGTGQSANQQSQQITWSFPARPPADKTDQNASATGGPDTDPAEEKKNP